MFDTDLFRVLMHRNDRLGLLTQLFGALVLGGLFLYALLTIDFYLTATLMVVLGVVAYLVYFLRNDARASDAEFLEPRERCYGYSGIELRTFVDSEGTVWIRASDIRRAMNLERSDTWMAKMYPEGFRRAHPAIAAYYISADTVRLHWKRSSVGSINRCLSWIDRELVPLQNGAPPVGLELGGSRCDGGENTKRLASEAPQLRHENFIVAHWRGRNSLAQALFGGGAFCFLVCVLCFFISAVMIPKDYVEHYRISALWDAITDVGAIALLAWWGVGAWRSARRWMVSQRSILIGVAVAIGGLTLFAYSLDLLASRDGHFGVMTSLMIAADLDGKADVSLSHDGKRLVMSGHMGMGTTEKVRRQLDLHPRIGGIELNSPGGRVIEGFALAKLIAGRGLGTFVQNGCASACVLAFAAGKTRMAAQSSKFGLHRSGLGWRKNGEGLSESDIAMRDFFLRQGISSDFVARGLTPPMSGIWVPKFSEVLASNLATSEWQLARPQ